MAQSAGFQGSKGTLFRTGEIQWQADPYLEVCEFLLSLYRDGHVVQGQYTSDTARPRWMAGQAAYMIDGIWIPGAIKMEEPDFLDKIGVGPPLTPQAGEQPVMYRGLSAGSYYISKESTLAPQASALLGRLLTDDFQKELARKMTQAPLDLASLDDPEVDKSFRKPLELAAKRCFLAPQLARGNPEVATALAKVPRVKPSASDIVKGLIAHEVKDARKALTTLSEKETKARDQALKKAGLDASDLGFPNWKPDQDFTDYMYT